MTAVFEITRPDELTRRVVFTAPPNWPNLATKISGLFSVPLEHVGVSYRDSDGDEVVLNSQEELEEFYVLSPPTDVVKLTVVDLTKGRVRALQSTCLEDPILDAVSEFYLTAWGKRWPSERKALYEADVSPLHSTTDETAPMVVDPDIKTEDSSDGADVGYPDGSVYQYDCLKNIDVLKRALLPTMNIPDVIVRREIYDTFLNSMTAQGDMNGFVVTGQPGIGKTVFLLYHLLRRLEKRQPTAIQLGDTYYVIFDQAGFAVNSVHDQDLRLQRCWALTDSNAFASQPCSPFLSTAQFIVQTTPPEPEKWRRWAKQKSLINVLIMDLPDENEIMAVVKERNYDVPLVPLVPGFVKKWGPCIRTILDLADAHVRNRLAGLETELEDAAKFVARRMCHEVGRFSIESFSWIGSGIHDQYSSIIFIAPRDDPGEEPQWRGLVSFVPTDYLWSIVEEMRAGASNEDAIKLFALFR